MVREDRSLIVVLKYETARAAEKAAKKRLDEAKRDYYNEMDSLYGEGKFDGKNFRLKADDVSFTATRVTRKKLIFDVTKLKKALPKQVANAVIKKDVTVTDYTKLSSYVKQLGGNATILKSMLSVAESIDEKKLNELSELGEFDESLVEDCFTVEESEPTYQLRAYNESK